MLEKMATFGPPENATEQVRTHFWAEIAPSEHLVQIYHGDDVFLDALEGFVAGGIDAGDGVIVIATPAHLGVLEHRLLTRGIDPASTAIEDQYLALDAKETLSKFMIDGPLQNGRPSWPDERLFNLVVIDLITRAGRRADGTQRRVRAFGEMVALLWAEGMSAATVRLEYLWHDFCQRSGLCLFCAYPRAYFTEDPKSSIRQICATHSRLISGERS